MNRQQRTSLDNIGAEPLEGSGFEDETPASNEEFDLETDQQEDQQ